jgi:hypothetical protein
MIRRITVAAVCLSAVAGAPFAAAEPIALVSHVAPVQAKQGHTRQETKYLRLYWRVVREHGRRAPGRNIVTRGIRTHGRVRDASRRELATSIRTFRRWLAPPTPPVASTDRVPHGQTPAYSGGRWAIPASIVMCESGGNYNAVNGSSGARGAYQLMPSTYAAYGGDGSWSPADQDRVAAKVWAGGAGRGQWSC